MLKQLDRGNPPRWEIYVRVNGKAYHRILKMTREDVTQVYADYLNQAGRAKAGLPFQKPGKILLRDVVSEYLAAMQQQGMNAKHLECVGWTLNDLGTVAGAKSDIRSVDRALLIRWRGWRVANPRQANWRKRKIPGATTLNKERAHISAFLTWAVQAGYLDSNPAPGLAKIRTAEPPIRSMPWEHFCALADFLWQTRPAVALLVEVLGESAARVDEVLQARVADVLHTGIWTGVKKGRRRVNLVAGPWVLHAAAQGRADAPLCPQPDGQAYSYEGIRDALSWACRRLNLPAYTAHWIRHSRATWNVEGGMSVRALQELMGHRSITTTERYFRAARAGRFASPPVREVATVLQSCCAIPVDVTKSQRIATHNHGAQKPENTYEKGGRKRKSL